MMEQGFLVFDSQWVEITEQEAANKHQVYNNNSVFNPIQATSLDPKDPDLLSKIFEPYVFETDGRFYRLNVSKLQTNRAELEELEKAFEAHLVEKQARKSGICPIRESIHNELFDEIIRQATVNLPERGILLMRIRDNLKMTFAAYQTLYQGSLVFASRKAQASSKGIAELQAKRESLRLKKIQLQNQVHQPPIKKILLQNELQSTQQGYREIQAIQQKARNQEIVYFSQQTKRLQEYLNGIYGD